MSSSKLGPGPAQHWTSEQRTEFQRIKALCDTCPFLYMRKDSLSLYYSRKHPTAPPLSLPGSELYPRLGDIELFDWGGIHFVLFRWKRTHLQKHPPRDLKTRLKYLAMPARCPFTMLYEMYTKVYGPIDKRELRAVLNDMWGEPTGGDDKYAIPSKYWFEKIKWPEYCPSDGNSTTSNNSRKRPAEDSDQEDEDGYIALDTGSEDSGSDVDADAQARVRGNGAKRARHYTSDEDDFEERTSVESSTYDSRSQSMSPQVNTKRRPGKLQYPIDLSVPEPAKLLPSTCGYSTRKLFSLLTDRARSRRGEVKAKEFVYKDLTMSLSDLPVRIRLHAADFFMPEDAMEGVRSTA